MKRGKWILVLTVLLGCLLGAQDKIHYVGAGGGITVGYGLTYRYWPDRFGVQGTFSPFWDGSELLLNFGTAGFMTLHETEATRLFLYAGGHYTFRSYEEEIWSDDYLTLLGTEKKLRHDWGIGLGPGIEVFFFENLALDIMFGYGFNTDMGNLGFTAEGFLSYRF